MKKTEKVIIGGLMAVGTALMVWQVFQQAIPQPQYACSIDGQKFMTYDELYQHFTTEHPAEPIEIIWE